MEIERQPEEGRSAQADFERNVPVVPVGPYYAANQPRRLYARKSTSNRRLTTTTMVIKNHQVIGDSHQSNSAFQRDQRVLMRLKLALNKGPFESVDGTLPDGVRWRMISVNLIPPSFVEVKSPDQGWSMTRPNLRGGRILTATEVNLYILCCVQGEGVKPQRPVLSPEIAALVFTRQQYVHMQGVIGGANGDTQTRRHLVY